MWHVIIEKESSDLVVSGNCLTSYVNFGFAVTRKKMTASSGNSAHI